jgi:D-alanyl-lipoteichoic acid acyltransferase DltB (MBOAT superfamily)
MLFNSWTFVPFILVVLGLYYVLPFRWQNRMLLAASCVFYGAWDYRFLSLLAFSTAIDYVVALLLHRSSSPGRRRALLAFSVVANLSILCLFKYFNFFAEGAAALTAALGLPLPAAHLDVILPLGISFYTFHAMSYTIDVYRGQLTPVRSFPDYMLFVLYFPQLVAGPIARARELMPQVTQPRTVRPEHVVGGLWLVLWGYFKKMVIADNLAALVNPVFASPEAAGGGQCLLALYAFAFQIYCDFSGYTDIARGLGKLMGFELARNFKLPYLARNPSDFWQRWHISLSSWLRDYLYVPLGGNRGGRLLTYRNLMLTMLLGGLWHGAQWNFVLWGGYHGLLLCGHRLLVGRREGAAKAGGLVTRLAARLLMFHLVCLGWLFFRSSDVAQVGTFLRLMATDFALDARLAPLLAALLLLAGSLWLLELWLRSADDVRTRWGWNWVLGPVTVSLLLAAIFFLTPTQAQQFIYFQF